MTAQDSAQLPADLQDERLIASSGVSGAVSAFTARLRSGDLGSVPVVVGLVIIWVVFQIANSSFLSSRNLVNLTLQTTSVGVIALGIGTAGGGHAAHVDGRDARLGRQERD